MKARKPHQKNRYTFEYRGKPPKIIVIDATSNGKAWKELRRHHRSHAKKKDFKVTKENLPCC